MKRCITCEWEGKERDLDVDCEATEEDGYICTYHCPECGKDEIEDI